MENVLTFFLSELTRLADAVSCEVAENGLHVTTFPCYRHLLLYPGGGAARQPGREGPPPLQLLLVVTEGVGVQILVRGAEAAPQGLTEGPDLGPVSQQSCRRTETDG